MTTNDTRRKALLWALAVGVAVAVAATTIFALTRRHMETIHNTYLLEKATLTARKNYERDELPARSYDTLLHRYARLLPSATEVTVDSLSPHALDTLRHYLGDRALAQLLAEGAAVFTYRGLPGAAIFYPDNEGSFYVLVYAANAYGQRLAYVVFGVAAALLLLVLALLAVAARWHAAYERERLFVAHASHQLNNPLAALRGECELALLHERSPDDYRAALARVAEQSDRLDRCLSSMLLLARHQRTGVARQRVDLLELCRTVAARHPRTVVVGSPCEVRSNPGLLELVVDNLLSNACKYSESEVTLTVTRLRRGCRVVVGDRGIGIPRHELRHIFTPFYRARNARGHEGSGVGLAIVARAADLLGAKVDIHSRPSSGTQVTLTLRDNGE